MEAPFKRQQYKEDLVSSEEKLVLTKSKEMSSGAEYYITTKEEIKQSPIQDDDNDFIALSEQSSSSGYQDSEPESDETWIEWHCKQKGNEFLCIVDKDFFDEANIGDMHDQFQYFERALNIITDYESEESNDYGKIDMDRNRIAKEEAVKLYIMAHQRYILTETGLDIMKRKFKRADYGYCPRVLCQMQPVLPWGEIVELEVCETKIYCPRCQGLYQPDYLKHQKIDGAAFGPSFAPLFILNNPDIVKEAEIIQQGYQPKMFGFKISKELSPLLPQQLNALS